MITYPILRPLAALCCAAALTATVSAQESEKPAKKAAPATEEAAPASETDPNDLLKRALTTMSGLTSYSAKGTFSAGGKTASISGSLGVGTLDLQVKGFDGKNVLRRSVKGSFWVSNDQGKTWEEDPSKEMTIILSSTITGPVSAEHKAWDQGKFKIVGEEKIDGEEVLHVQKPQEGKAAAMDFWLAKDEKLGLIIRKASLIIEASDGEFPVVMTYSKLNEPVEIAAPDKAAKPAAE